MEEKSNNKMVSFVYAGPLGDPKVVEALMGHPVQVDNIAINGWEIRRQPLEAIANEKIKENVKKHWDEKGMPYRGAFTLIRSENGIANVSKFTVPKDEWLRKRNLIEEWGFHSVPEDDGAEDGKESKPWMKFDAVIQRGEDGNIAGKYITETIVDQKGLEPVTSEYWETGEYKTFVDQMAEGIRGFRTMIEGNSAPPGIIS